MTLLKELLILKLCFCIFQKQVADALVPETETRAFGGSDPQYEVLSEEEPASIEMPSDDELKILNQQANEKLTQLLNDETLAESLTFIGADLKKILESEVASNIITEVAARVKTIMTNEEALLSVKAIQEHVKFFLMGRNTPGRVQNIVNRYVNLVTDPSSPTLVEEKWSNIIQIVDRVGPLAEVTEETKQTRNVLLDDPKVVSKVNNFFETARLLAIVDPAGGTVKGIAAQIPRLAMNKAKDAFKSLGKIGKK